MKLKYCWGTLYQKKLWCIWKTRSDISYFKQILCHISQECQHFRFVYCKYQNEYAGLSNAMQHWAYHTAVQTRTPLCTSYVICKVSDLVNFYLWIIACGYVNALKSSYHICGTQIYINTKIHINRSSNEININKFHTDSAFCRSRLRFA